MGGTNRSHIHCGALLTNIRLSVGSVCATRGLSQNSGSCHEIEMCEPREERQPATTAHRGAVQALVETGLGRALAGDAQLRSVGAQACTPSSRRHRSSPKEEAPPYKTRCGLALNGTVTEEIYEVGFNASTRFREESSDILAVRHWLAAE